MATLVDQNFFARMQALNDKFAAGVPATLESLRAARARIDVGAPDPAALQSIYQTLHTVAGSAATFGFAGFGQQARVIEQALIGLRESDSVTPAQWQAWLERLDHFVAWAARDPKSAYADPYLQG